MSLEQANSTDVFAARVQGKLCDNVPEQTLQEHGLLLKKICGLLEGGKQEEPDSFVKNSLEMLEDS